MQGGGYAASPRTRRGSKLGGGMSQGGPFQGVRLTPPEIRAKR
jgi:hypothetical protein